MTIKQQTSNDYGISQELLVLSILANYGTVSIPYGNSGRYDCILDINGKFYKIQIKSLNIVDNRIIVPMSNTRMSAEGSVSKIYTPDQVDYIAVCYNNNVYLFATGLAKKTYTVSIDLPEDEKQHYIEDYHIDKVLNIQLKSWIDLKNQNRKKLQENKVNLKKEYYCPDCGAIVSKQGNRCVKCSKIASRIVDRPTRDELKIMIRTIPFTTIAKKYSVSDTSIKKWCKDYNLPSRSKDIMIYSEDEWKEV